MKAKAIHEQIAATNRRITGEDGAIIEDFFEETEEQEEYDFELQDIEHLIWITYQICDTSQIVECCLFGNIVIQLISGYFQSVATKYDISVC